MDLLDLNSVKETAVRFQYEYSNLKLYALQGHPCDSNCAVDYAHSVSEHVGNPKVQSDGTNHAHKS